MRSSGGSPVGPGAAVATGGSPLDAQARAGTPRPELVLPDYGGACISSLLPAMLAALDGHEPPPWCPPLLAGAAQVVLLVLDGLGWRQLEARRRDAAVLSAMEGGPITSVAPTTTATALTSIATGLVPAEHGVVGYRMRTERGVLNVLRWTIAGEGGARATVDPSSIQPAVAFAGRPVPVVSRAEFAGSGFSEAHLAGSRLVGWRVPSSIAVDVRRLLRGGEPLVYAYYDGVDKVAHERGLGEHYDAEVSYADRLVAALADVLPQNAVLLVTADHGQVEVTAPPLEIDADLAADVAGLSGEGRFRWVHARPGRSADLAAACRERFGHLAWVRTREEAEADGWFGGRLSPQVAARLGDVALVAREPVAFADPADTGELKLVARHGSLTADEVLVPLLAARG